jgi:L-alanine-DL-glutamate epimerase-like enolase superfamily enzyme
LLKLNHFISELPFEYPFTISKGTKTHQRSLVVELTWGNGIKAYGEAPAISYYDITVEKMQEDLEMKRKFIESFSFTDPKRFWHFLHHLYPSNPFLVSALDMAGWDLHGKMRKKSLYEIFNVDPSKAPLTDYTIGIDTLEKMIDKIKLHPSPIYKIKVGGDDDLKKLIEIRKITDSIIRIDANAGWVLDQAISYMPILNELSIELIEQPLAKEDHNGVLKLREHTSIPIIADESCIDVKDLEKCKDVFSGINIKLTKCSGITPALEMIKKARSYNMRIMLGCMNESTVGTAALGHLAPLVDYLDADGPLLLSDDIATGIKYHSSQLIVSKNPGLGIAICVSD